MFIEIICDTVGFIKNNTPQHPQLPRRKFNSVHIGKFLAFVFLPSGDAIFQLKLSLEVPK
jgi:hypothetical protein